MHAPRHELSPELRLGLAGVSAIGVSFGFARYGYGLFLPEIRREFALPIDLLGVIGSATYVGYVIALVLVGVLAARVGPRPLIVTAGLSAAVGMALVAFAPNAAVLVVGLVLAGTSSGWVWAPYSDAVPRVVPAARRERMLAVLPTGTAFGTVAAGALTLVATGPGWRYAWAFFAAVAVLVTVHNARLLPGGANPAGPEPDARARFFRRAAVPLFLTALSYGLIGSVYWTFAAELVATGPTAAALLWTLIGSAGIGGLAAGAVIERLGLRWTHALLFSMLAAAVLALGAAPGSFAAAGLSAVLYGPAFMAVSGLLAVWSYQIFPEHPATGFSAVVLFLGIGTIIGPAALGVVADGVGLPTTFLVTAGLALLTLPIRPASAAEPVRSR
ncbi:YbfB/YjiJ family MFS transporter [Saccharopolyspora sp. K220]|uniref:MFS transporter n=1 Tax=Saccharopolyspora soli TaxID=2926618 RepID=UPI001F5A5D55|nr:MFS transporter [Saccharopolyspora soli]MCI2422088.1 YbfB/YjiJ family MFS transporter [Saccharopolyspora soli]